MGKIKIKAPIVRQEFIASDVLSIVIKDKEIASSSLPGQFVNLYSGDGSKLMPRPISICEVNRELDEIRLVYRILGEGTMEFSKLAAGDSIEILGPLGNGFKIENKKALLIGGGIGIPPMLELAKSLKCEKSVVLGFRDELFLVEDFEKIVNNVYIASEDGKNGIKGNVLDVIKKQKLNPEIIYACGPTPMLKAIKEYSEENHIICQLSLEEKMACGIGACLACVCKTKEKDHHSKVNNSRICKEGPVFYGSEVEL